MPGMPDAATPKTTRKTATKRPAQQPPAGVRHTTTTAAAVERAAVGREIDARLTRLRAELEVLRDNAERLARLAKPVPGQP